MRASDDIIRVIIPDLFQRSSSERQADSFEAMRREMPKICAILDLDPDTLRPIDER